MSINHGQTVTELAYAAARRDRVRDIELELAAAEEERAWLAAGNAILAERLPNDLVMPIIDAVEAGDLAKAQLAMRRAREWWLTHPRTKLRTSTP